MWYAIQVMVGSEQRMAERISAVVPHECLSECFFAQYETEIKVKGKWTVVHKPMFPGYLVAVSDSPHQLDRSLRNINGFARVVTQDKVCIPLAREEVELIDSCTECGNRVVPMSRGMKDGDVVTIQQGPLVGYQARITNINRHKSIATIEFDLCGRTVTARLGLSLVSKSTSASQ